MFDSGDGEMEPLAAIAAHWAQLAVEQDQQADWEISQGYPYGNIETYRHRANTYRRTAEVLMLEAKTGRPHCSLCLGDHPNHLHMHQG